MLNPSTAGIKRRRQPGRKKKFTRKSWKLSPLKSIDIAKRNNIMKTRLRIAFLIFEDLMIFFTWNVPYKAYENHLPYCCKFQDAIKTFIYQEDQTLFQDNPTSLKKSSHNAWQHHNKVAHDSQFHHFFYICSASQLWKIQYFQRLPIVRTLSKAAVHTNKAAFRGALLLQIFLQEKRNVIHRKYFEPVNDITMTVFDLPPVQIALFIWVPWLYILAKEISSNHMEHRMKSNFRTDFLLSNENGKFQIWCHLMIHLSRNATNFFLKK